MTTLEIVAIKKRGLPFRARHGVVFPLTNGHMSSELPAVGTKALLDQLTIFVPDDFINEHWPVPRRPGPRRRFSTAQLWRVHLLAPLTGGRSFNAIQRSLYEDRIFRRFAHLPNERTIPDVRMLHELRRRLGPGGFRAINDHLCSQILLCAPLRDKTVALIDATDLPASTRDKKKTVSPGARLMRRWERVRSNQDVPVFSLGIKNIPSDYGSMVLSGLFC